MTAVRFSLKFYQEVAAGSPVDRAAQNGRRAIGLATQYKRRDFATPVIFMRVEDGHLFVREGETNRDEVSPTPKPTNNRGTTTPIPLTANVTPLHKLIDQRFSLDDIRQMCRPVGVDFDNLQGPGKRIKAQDLGAYAQRRGRLGVLVNEIAEMDPTLLDELKGNLYLFMESIKAHEVAQLCQELKLDCQALKLDENGLLGYDANPYIRTERMKGLQDHMVQNGRYAELVQAVKIRLPHEDLTTFER
jgi:hypothetical protein